MCRQLPLRAPKGPPLAIRCSNCPSLGGTIFDKNYSRVFECTNRSRLGVDCAMPIFRFIGWHHRGQNPFSWCNPRALAHCEDRLNSWCTKRFLWGCVLTISVNAQTSFNVESVFAIGLSHFHHLFDKHAFLVFQVFQRVAALVPFRSQPPGRALPGNWSN